jgi:hypothetical protein
MTKSAIPLWDPVAANNTDVAGISLAEGIMRPPAVNNSLRELMAEVARFYADLGGVNTVAGTGDVITLTSASVFTALATGLILSFKAGATNTTATTINVDGLGAKAIRKVTSAEVALAAADLVADGRYILIYDAAANGAAGAWLLINPATVSVAAPSGVLPIANGGTGAASLAALLQAGVTNTITKGFSLTPNNLGNVTNFTINPTVGNYQYGTNHGAATWTAPASDCAVEIDLINDATAGSITFVGFTGTNHGDSLDTVNGHSFTIILRRNNGISRYAIKAWQ